MATNDKISAALNQIAKGEEPDEQVGGDLTQPMDLWVASRVRAARQMKGWSLTTLAERLGLKKRQRIEKWEKGQNRIFASQLWAFAQALDVHPGWFFDDFPIAGQQIPRHRGEALTAMLDHPDVVPFIRLFVGLQSKEQRDAVMTMLRGMAAQQPQRPE